MEIDFKLVEWIQVINDNQLHVNINGIGIKLLEFNKMDINGVTYKSSDEFITVNKLTVLENIIE